MKMKALKPLGEEKPAAITDTEFSDTLVDVPLPDSEPETESKTKNKTKTKTDQPSADSVQNIQDQNHCRADSIKDAQFASTQATSPGPPSDHKYMPKPARHTRALSPAP